MPLTWLPLAVLFESPLVAGALAVGAVAVPVLIHLLNRRRFKVVTWAAMRFLLAAQKQNSRRLRIEQLILLLTRILIVLLLILRLGTALTVGFEQYYLQRGSLGAQAAEVLDTFIYFRGIQGGDWGFAAAVGLVRGLVGTGLIVTANAIARRFGEEGVY